MSLGRNLRRLMESQGVVPTLNMFFGMVESGKIKARSVSFRDIAENVVGYNYWEKLSAFNASAPFRLRESMTDCVADHTVRTLESGAGEAVDASAFADITGQLLINEVREGFKNPMFIGDSLVKTVPITNGNLGTQITPWLSDVLGDGQVVQPGMPYPHTKFVEQYVRHPKPVKHGQICSVTMEMLYSDLTSQAMDRANSVGRALGYEREKEILNVVYGITNTYAFGNEAALTSYNTFQAGPLSASVLWINSIANELLVDWSNINTLEQLFYNMVDPATGRRILVEPKIMLVTPPLKYTAKRAIHATETRSGDITSGDGRQVVAANPLDRNYNVITSPITTEVLVDSGVTAAKAATYWQLIDTDKAYEWREVYGLRTESAPKGNPLEFNQDIAVQVKGGYFGVAATGSPYHVARGYDD
jgi:hypothetical protein